MKIDGRNVEQLTSDELAELRSTKIGFVFQQFNLMPRTSAFHNVLLPLTYAMPRPPDSEERARQRLAEVELADRADHHPSQLSGDQQQRVAIARALKNSP